MIYKYTYTCVCTYIHIYIYLYIYIGILIYIRQYMMYTHIYIYMYDYSYMRIHALAINQKMHVYTHMYAAFVLSNALPLAPPLLLTFDCWQHYISEGSQDCWTLLSVRKLVLPYIHCFKWAGDSSRPNPDSPLEMQSCEAAPWVLHAPGGKMIAFTTNSMKWPPIH